MAPVPIAMYGRADWKTEDVMETIRLESLSDDDWFDEVEAQQNASTS